MHFPVSYLLALTFPPFSQRTISLTNAFYHSVAEKLKQEGKHEIFQNETMEELEDDDGNVYNRKTYEDLKKQGII